MTTTTRSNSARSRRTSWSIHPSASQSPLARRRRSSFAPPLRMSDLVQQKFDALFGPEFGHGKAFDIFKISDVLEALGAPEKRLPYVIHVAGTNGKGSTIAFMRAIAEAGGLRVHAFTKPHLL